MSIVESNIVVLTTVSSKYNILDYLNIFVPGAIKSLLKKRFNANTNLCILITLLNMIEYTQLHDSDLVKAVYSRKLLKHCIMTSIYGAGFNRVHEHLWSHSQAFQ